MRCAVVEANQPRKEKGSGPESQPRHRVPNANHPSSVTRQTVESRTIAGSTPLFPTPHAFTVLGRRSSRAVRHRARHGRHHCCRRRRRKVGIVVDLFLPFFHPGGNMSSLAAARADNFYYPPEWSPKKGGLNKFEMPFNIWCGGCNSMIAKGVRFNAEKKQVGNYYSTKIWSFTMKSPCCKHEIVIQTDPKNTEYVIISGAQKKTEDFDVEDAETLLLPADEDRDKLADPMYRLEHQEEDLRKKKEAEPVLVRLQRLSDSRHSDDYALNRALRDRLRSQKKRVAEEKKSARKIGLGVRLLPPSAEDATAAASVKFASKFEKSRRDKRAAIKAASIFPESSSSASHGKPDLVLKRRNIKAGAATALMAGRVKPSSWQSASSTSSRTRMPVLAARK
ncbi:Nuclear protein-like [Zea mays]|uniref:Nuclear protein-like n=1 Tax=Zea mays TaxID=4577 RepID=A0A1D6JF74_MAIZE|nr:Nuclear protein-like [Zea mays]